MLPCPQLSTISIHALLAESDPTTVQNIELGYISIHALLAESDLAEVFKLWRESHFYPRSPCGERLADALVIRRLPIISIHALLAESDLPCPTLQGYARYFYPRSPCGERRNRLNTETRSARISIHALLAESDRLCVDTHEPACRFLSTLSLRRATKIDGTASPTQNDFYPRSPCGERPAPAALSPSSALISIHALLAESDTDTIRKTQRPYVISIHALLAESDRHWQMGHSLARQFLSTLSLRRATSSLNADSGIRVFLSTLSLRRATLHSAGAAQRAVYFYPRSPCGERPAVSACRPATRNFYPRSPCGERHGKIPRCSYVTPISIHALLAESDQKMATAQAVTDTISIHALLAESDLAKSPPPRPSSSQFLSTLSLRRATVAAVGVTQPADISIHALLAESDLSNNSRHFSRPKFLSTLSLRRATGVPSALYHVLFKFLSTLSLRRATAIGRRGTA